MPRPKKKPDYDSEKMMEQLIEEIADAYLHSQGHLQDEDGRVPLSALAEEFSLSALKVRKLLVTAGIYDSPSCRRVQDLYATGKNVKEICQLTGLSAASVSGYLPYRKTIYNLEERTVLADRLQRYRERKKAVQRVEEMLPCGISAGLYNAVWDAVCLFEGYPFQTMEGLRFSYKISGNEIFISGEKILVTRSVVDRALETILELQNCGNEIIGSIKHDYFGVSYLYPIFQRLGIIMILK